MKKEKHFYVYSHCVDALHKDTLCIELCEDAFFDLCDFIEETLCADVQYTEFDGEDSISFNNRSDFFRSLALFVNHQANTIDWQRKKIIEFEIAPF